MVLPRNALLFAILGFTMNAAGPAAQTWHLDRLDRIGGHATTVQGSPKIIRGPHGKAIEFNGEDDAIFLDTHPMAGFDTWTWEVIFRPDPGGRPEQRFFHLQENGGDNRMLFEIRVIGDQWCMDSFVKYNDASRTLIDHAKLHPLGQWYHAAEVYDGHEFRNYIDSVLESRGPVHLRPQGAGRTSLGARLNKVYYFKGAIWMARMTPRVLGPSEFLRK